MAITVAANSTGARLFAAVVLRALAWKHRPYQPIFLNGRQVSAGRRDCTERLQVVLDLAAEVEAETVMDLGCSEGFFVRRCAEAGYLAVGVDGSAPRLAMAQWSTTMDGVDGCGFFKMGMTPDSIRRLPAADVTVSLSVLHHVLAEDGVDGARKTLEAIRERTRRALVFEMGQSDEPNLRLPDMGGDPHSWAADLLVSAGFHDPVKVAEVPSYSSDVRRATFTAKV